MSLMQFTIDTFPPHYSDNALGFLCATAVAAGVVALWNTISPGIRPADPVKRPSYPPHGTRRHWR